MRASEFVIEPSTVLIGKLAQTGKIVQVLKQKQGPAFAKDKDEVWTLIDTDPSRTNKISDNAKWIPSDTEFEWVREYLKKIDEQQLDEGLRDWIAALAATGAIALGTPAMAKPVPTTTAVSQQAYNQISQALATPAAQTLKKTAIKAGIVGTELAQFMAQCAHETANFTSLEEFGGSLDFRKYDPKYNPRKAKQLGNKVAGDGAKYKGRGFIQLTGRDNYKRAGQALGLPLEQRPELVERPDVAAKVAVWFWQNRVAPKVASFHDTQQATKPINPAMRGLSDRHTKFNAIKQGAMASPKDMAPRGRRI